MAIDSTGVITLNDTYNLIDFKGRFSNLSINIQLTVQTTLVSKNWQLLIKIASILMES